MRLAFKQALEQAGARESDLAYIATTGEGEVVEFRLTLLRHDDSCSRRPVPDPTVRAVVDAERFTLGLSSSTLGPRCSVTA